MAMSTGTVTTLDDLYDAFITFCLANGWTLNETVTTRDKVLRSTGTNGKRSMNYRHTASSEAGYPYKFAAAVEKGFPHFITRGYQNWTTGVGLNEYGTHGPWLVTGENAISGGGMQVTYVGEAGVDTFPMTANTTTLKARQYTSPTYANRVLLNLWDGVRHMIDIARSGAAYPAFVDMWANEAVTITATAAPGTNSTAPCVVWELSTNKPIIYVLAHTATLANQFVKIDTETGAVISLASPLWTASVPTGGALTWDGADTIYALHGNATTEFAKYTISTNTWTTLAVAPVARATAFANPTGSGTPLNFVYVPNSVTGIGQDVIYAALAASGTVIYRYDVTSDAWRSTSGTGALTCPFTITNLTSLVWDNKKYFFIFAPNVATNAYYRSDLSVAPNTFTALGVLNSATAGAYGLMYQETAVGKTRGSTTLPTKYWFIGDADGVSVITRIGTSYFWTYFGLFTSKYRTTVMKTTGAVSPGNKVTINVETSVNYSGGERVIIYDPATASNESTLVASVPNGTSVVVNSLTNSYGIGSLLGVDPAQQIITGGSGYGVTAFDSRGYRSSPQTPTYAVSPDKENTFASGLFPGGLSNSRDYLQPDLMRIHSPYAINTFEDLGYLGRVFAIPAGNYPTPQPESTITFAGQNYLVISPYGLNRNVTQKYNLAFGPF